ncbi:general stress protein [Salinicoccus siamensis]|uniref:General stress protein n=2 Tax=Salinicoccus siamensis TaxID=381830 RepID=A0ABV5Z3K5_9STAP
MRKIETFLNEQELTGRIEGLKEEGIKEKQMTVISSQNIEGASVNYNDVNYKNADGTTWDKIVAWFSSESPEDHVMTELNLSTEEEKEYKEALDSGKILLYVSDEEKGATIDAPTDPLLETDENRVDKGHTPNIPDSTPGAVYATNKLDDNENEKDKTRILDEEMTETPRNQDLVDTHHMEGSLEEESSSNPDTDEKDGDQTGTQEMHVNKTVEPNSQKTFTGHNDKNATGTQEVHVDKTVTPDSHDESVERRRTDENDKRNGF